MIIWSVHEEKQGAFLGDNSNATVLTQSRDLVRAVMSYRKLFVTWGAWHTETVGTADFLLPYTFDTFYQHIAEHEPNLSSKKNFYCTEKQKDLRDLLFS